jgi:Flagellar biosynthesis/type III secretory pathway protein
MSDLGFLSSAGGRNLFDAVARPVGFMPSVRFGAGSAAKAPEPEATPEPELVQPEEQATDPVADAFTAGFAAGYEQALTEAQAQAAETAAARDALELSIVRLDAALEEELRLRLRDTVAALCESALAPLAIDEDALKRRIDRAVAMLARVDDERVIRLHPDDLELVSSRISQEWHVETDARLERGTIRIESSNGGVEDGPATWRIAIAEALHQC